MGVFVAIITSIAALVLSHQANSIASKTASGYYDEPIILPVRHYTTGHICPSFPQSFTVNFANKGKKLTTLCVNVTSSNFNFSKSSDCIAIASGEGTEFVFRPLYDFNTFYLRNISIDYTWYYFSNSGQKLKNNQVCNYSMGNMGLSLDN